MQWPRACGKESPLPVLWIKVERERGTVIEEVVKQGMVRESNEGLEGLSCVRVRVPAKTGPFRALKNAARLNLVLALHVITHCCHF